MLKRLLIPIMSVVLFMPALAADVEVFNDGPMAGKGYPFSESVRVGDILFLSGEVGIDESDNLVAGGIEAEAEQTIKNIRASLERRGLDLSNVVKCTIFLADINEWGRFNKVYTTFFEPPYPARSAFGANGLALEARVEVECIAAYP